MRQPRGVTRIPIGIKILVGVMVLSGVGPNFLLTLLASFALWLGFSLLWRPGESPIFLYVFVYQWLQASVKIFQANLSDQPVMALADYGGDIGGAASLSLIALLMLAMGMRRGAGHPVAWLALVARDQALRFDVGLWFKLYLVALIVSMAATAAAGLIPSLAQLLLALAGLKWAFFFMLTYAAFVRPSGQRRLWTVAFLLEFLMGLVGYFSGFTKVMMFSLMGVLAGGVRFTSGRVFALCLMGGLTLLLAVVWSAVKMEYRSYLSGGQSAQIVTVGYSAGLSKLGELVMALDQHGLERGSEKLISRISYVDFFGSVLGVVPETIPHTEGDLWLDAISRPFMPRALFPEKSAIHDSARTREYTGIMVSGAEQGTSISIGYVGESYIDFGTVGMMPAIWGFGWLLGRSYRWMAQESAMRGLLGMGLANAVLFGAALLESSITKVFGGLIAAYIVVWLLNRLVFPRYLSWLLLAGRGDRGASAPRAALRRA